jgi:hypothetical protein
MQLLFDDEKTRPGSYVLALRGSYDVMRIMHDDFVYRNAVNFAPVSQILGLSLLFFSCHNRFSEYCFISVVRFY